MTTVKKIILFLFGIVLIVFGNKAAIDTIFKNNDGLKEPDPNEKEAEATKAVITDEIISNDTIETIVPEIPEVKERLKEEMPKKETSKVVSVKSTEKKLKDQVDKSSNKTEEAKLEEAPKTKIEPVQEESAAPSE